MLTGVMLLFACLGLFVAVFWLLANDRVGPDEPTRGLLAMREHETGQGQRHGRHRNGESGRETGSGRAGPGAGPGAPPR